MKKNIQRKLRIAIIGTGNIGTDLLMKIERSPLLECTLFAGQNSASKGILRAKKIGINTSDKSIQAIIDNPDCCDIVVDATSADSHIIHAPILKKLKKFVIDMTPSRIGKMCIPVLNLEECLEGMNVNMITCGGQATVPLISAIMKIHPEIHYIEVVSSIASKSAGIGTRNNIDEYTQATSDAIRLFTNVAKAKAIVILNPAEPPILMHNTIYVQIEKPKMELIDKKIEEMVTIMQKYIPGFKLILKPVYDNVKLTCMVEVVGRGDFLPIYAGNLDIINCAAIAVAEAYAKIKTNVSEIKNSRK